jgi:Lon protease-like protein
MPLHIFEERYKAMISMCLEEEREFGIVYYDGSALKSTGCLARITEVMERYPDGRLDINTVGTRRFEIDEVHQDKSYMQATVDYFDDHDRHNPHVDTALQEQAYKLLVTIADLTKTELVDVSLADIKPQRMSFLIAGSSGFSNDEKQRFQEMRSTAERLEKGIEALDKIVERIRINLEVRKIVGGNGHLPELLP